MSHLRLDTVMVSTIPVRTFFDGMPRFLHFFTPQQNTIFVAKKVKTLGNQVLSRVAKTLNTRILWGNVSICLCLCPAAALGVSVKKISTWEHGMAIPDEEEMGKIDAKVSL